MFSFFPGFSVLFWRVWSLTSKEIIFALGPPGFLRCEYGDFLDTHESFYLPAHVCFHDRQFAGGDFFNTHESYLCVCSKVISMTDNCRWRLLDNRDDEIYFYFYARVCFHDIQFAGAVVVDMELCCELKPLRPLKVKVFQGNGEPCTGEISYC